MLPYNKCKHTSQCHKTTTNDSVLSAYTLAYMASHILDCYARLVQPSFTLCTVAPREFVGRHQPPAQMNHRKKAWFLAPWLLL